MSKLLKHFFDDNFLFDIPMLKVSMDLASDVYEKNGNVIAEISIPGMDPDRFDISIENDTLKVSGEREEDKETKNHEYCYREIRRGSFSRILPLPASVIPDKTTAEYKDGILKIVMPKKKGMGGERVKIAVKGKKS